jgi:hypothetical protein
LTDCYGDSIVSRATASYGCSALGPVILGVNFEGSERPEVAASGHSRRVGHHGVWPKRCIHAERRGLMQISESRYVLLLPLQSHPSDVKTESTPKCRAFRLASPISSYRPLKWPTASAILKSVVRKYSD